MNPINMKMWEVQALLDNRKAVMRRVVKPQPIDTDECQHEMQTYDKMLPQFYKGDYSCVCRKCGYGTQPDGESIFHPSYRPGDILYVPEKWKYAADSQIWGEREYRIVFWDGGKASFFFEDVERKQKWEKYIYKPEDR